MKSDLVYIQERVKVKVNCVGSAADENIVAYVDVLIGGELMIERSPLLKSKDGKLIFRAAYRLSKDNHCHDFLTGTSPETDKKYLRFLKGIEKSIRNMVVEEYKKISINNHLCP
jgi:hypothetical protein